MGAKRTAGDVARPWEPRARAVPGHAVGSMYIGGARRSDTVRGWEAAVESPPVERDFLSHFTGGEGGKRMQCRIRRDSSLSLPLSLCLGSEVEEQQNRETDDSIRGHHVHAAPAPAQPVVERNFLPQFGGGGEDENGRGRDSSLSLPLGLRLGSEQGKQERDVDAASRGHHGHAPAPALPPLSAPRQASVGAPGYSYLLPRQASVGAPRRPAPRRPPSAPPAAKHTPPSPGLAPPQRPPRAPAPAGLLNPTARQDRNNVRVLGTRLPQQPELQGSGDVKENMDEAAQRAEESWRAALGSETRDRHIREAWLSQHGWLAGQAVSAAMAASARAPAPAAAAGNVHMQWAASADARFGCPACRCGPPTLVTAPRPHLCLCWECGYIFRDDPAVACPVCAAVRAWGIRA